MRRLLGGVSLFLSAAAATPAQQPGNTSAKPPEPPRFVKLAPAAVSPKAPALRHALLPPVADLTPGNAAPVWIRAGLAHQEDQRKVRREDFPWFFGGAGGEKEPTPERVKALLANFERTLRLADQAARCRSCDWERPLLTVQDLNNGLLPLDEIQLFRSVAQILSYRCEAELKGGQFDAAARTLQSGFALARDVGNGNTVVENLVGLAIESIMLGRVEEWSQQPGAPSLYWALTDLPSPLVDVRHTFRIEFDTMYRSFPPLRKVARAGIKPMTAGEAAQLVNDLRNEMGRIAGWEPVKLARAQAMWPAALGAGVALVAELPAAKRYLVDRGQPAARVDALPPQQAVLLFHMSRYEELRDDLLKWLTLSSWQVRDGFDRGCAAVQTAKADLQTPLVPFLYASLALQTPGMQKTLTAHLRIQRQHAGLRCAEALRLYAAAHGGKPPLKLGDVTEVPLPVDPVTGRGFDELYSEREGTGVLTVPPAPREPAQIGRRYELAKPR